MSEEQKQPWSRHVESMSDGNNGWGEEETYVCSWCGERSPDGNAYASMLEAGKSVCQGCHELEEVTIAERQG